MDDTAILQIAHELQLDPRQVQATVALLNDGATVPFIARYRKEATRSLDEVAITSIRDHLARIRELWSRRETILASLQERDLLTDELREAVLAAETMTALEDVYLPYRPKRRTRATIARERGLEPLALLLWDQRDFDVDLKCAEFVDPKLGVESVADALAGARDIMAEWVSEDPSARAKVRSIFWNQGIISSRLVSDQVGTAAKYRDYFQWDEPIAEAPSHRVLAMLRGAQEGVLSVHLTPPLEPVHSLLLEIFLAGDNPAAQQVRLAVQDGYKRLLEPSLETEVRNGVRIRAEEAAIRVFASNLRELLLAAPLGQKNVLALDPGFRTGCKLVCLDRQGQLLHHDTIYPLLGQRGESEAASTVKRLCQQYQIEIIAVGNGTGGRETEAFLRSIELDPPVPVVLVNESGASVYSASEVGRAEFPDADITVRGAVSIGRRLMDPLAELVKIDPKAIGVGQYQHDVDQKALKERLDEVVGSCVNSVGVEVNTASADLLSYVSGLGPRLAQSIVEYRNSHGAFTSRQGLKQVPRLGPKAFEQSAGFLRIQESSNPLDASAVHPESYRVVESIARDLDLPLEQIVGNASLSRGIDPHRYVSSAVGLPTLMDIVAELARPGRDPRQEFEPFSFTQGVTRIEDLKAGMELPGVVTNVTDFGAFVDVGVHQDGLVHISQLADRFVRHPSEVVKVQQRVWVRVLEIDRERHRIALSLRDIAQPV